VNFQNIPRSDKTVKQAFIPKLDALMFFDYKQIEYRLLAFYIAHTLQDLSMAEVFARGDDLHAESARAILDKQDVTDEERNTGKTYNFLTIYGGGAAKAAESLGIPFKVAQRQQKVFHERWPSIKLLNNPPFRNGGYGAGEVAGVIQNRLESRGYITTLWGRHLHPEAPHKALNALVQGCAADLLRASLVKAHEGLIEEGFQSHLVNNVHDELIIDATLEEVPELALLVPHLMDDALISEFVPVEVDVEWTTTNWADKQPYKEASIAAVR
jgi:DNA polymerase-1